MESKGLTQLRRIFVAGHSGMVGSAIVRRLRQRDNVELITRPRSQLELTNQAAVNAFMAETKPDEIYLAAARVGGIYANNEFPANFIYENLLIAANLIHAAHLHGVQKLLFLGSSCIYPKLSEQPIVESALLSGYLEPTNEPYAVAKIAGIKLCESYRRQFGHDYRCLMPTNLYGPGDNFHPKLSHVIPGLIHRFHTAAQKGEAEVIVWGTGTPKRDFLFADDLASACTHIMEMDAAAYANATEPMLSHVNVGGGREHSIASIAERISILTGFNGKVVFDHSKPDGPKRKLVSNSKIEKLGWSPATSLDEGLKITYKWFLKHRSQATRSL